MSEKKELSFDVLIGIPKGNHNEYEYDFILRKVHYDHMIFSSMMYPVDYGLVPESLALDSDPSDVLVLVTEPIFPGCMMEVKPIEVFRMTDEKRPDEKVICIPVSDPVWDKMNDLSGLSSHLIKEIEHLFSVYKDLKKKKVTINGWGDMEEMVKVYHECKERYMGSRKDFSIS